jgi:hypothetical protein
MSAVIYSYSKFSIDLRKLWDPVFGDGGKDSKTLHKERK